MSSISGADSIVDVLGKGSFPLVSDPIANSRRRRHSGDVGVLRGPGLNGRSLREKVRKDEFVGDKFGGEEACAAASMDMPARIVDELRWRDGALWLGTSSGCLGDDSVQLLSTSRAVGPETKAGLPATFFRHRKKKERW